MGNSINVCVYAHNDIVKQARIETMFPGEPRSYYDEFDWYFDVIYSRYLTRRARIAPLGSADTEDEVSTQASDGD